MKGVKKMDIKHFRTVQGCLLAGIWSNQLYVRQTENECEYSFASLLVNIKKDSKPTESWYWRIEWYENEEGDDLLIIKEQDTPEPLDYSYELDITKYPLIAASNISLEHNRIKKVSGYGFKVNGDKNLTSIVFELEKNYVLFDLSGPIVTAKIRETLKSEVENPLFLM
jgi:hypothetical protein